MYLDERLRPLYVEPNGRFEESTLLVRANIGLHTALTLCLLSYLFEEPTLLDQLGLQFCTGSVYDYIVA